MKKTLLFIVEVLVVQVLLLTNVVMGNFTRTALDRDISLLERINEALTLENLIISLIAGIIATYVLTFWVKRHS